MTDLKSFLTENLGLSFDEECTPRTEQEKAENYAARYNNLEGELNKRDQYDCRLCRNKGAIMEAYEPIPGTWSTITYRCKCLSVRKAIMNLQRSGLKNLITDYTFEKFETKNSWQETLKKAAEEYAAKPEGWLFLGGQSGAGKTHLCTAVCRKLLYDGRAVKYMLWRDESVNLKASLKNGEEYRQLMEPFKLADVLYIDDLFKTARSDGEYQRPTDADINIAFEILNYRYTDPKLLTIISSECTMNDILEIDEAIGGRIFERATAALCIGRDQSKNYRLKSVVEL